MNRDPGGNSTVVYLRLRVEVAERVEKFVKRTGMGKSSLFALAVMREMDRCEEPRKRAQAEAA